jgi:hypothetical protein
MEGGGKSSRMQWNVAEYSGIQCGAEECSGMQWTLLLFVVTNHASSIVRSALLVTSTSDEISTAMKGPISAPDGEMTPKTAARRSVQKLLDTAKMHEVTNASPDPISSVFLRPNLSAEVARYMLMNTSPRSVRDSINPISSALNDSSFRYITSITARKPYENIRMLLEAMRSLASRDRFSSTLKKLDDCGASDSELGIALYCCGAMVVPLLAV